MNQIVVPQEQVDAFVKQVSAAVDKASLENLGCRFVVVALSPKNVMVTASTSSIPDPLTRISLLAEAIKAEASRLQQALHQASQAETMRLVQKSTESMTRN